MREDATVSLVTAAASLERQLAAQNPSVPDDTQCDGQLWALWERSQLVPRASPASSLHRLEFFRFAFESSRHAHVQAPACGCARTHTEILAHVTVYGYRIRISGYAIGGQAAYNRDAIYIVNLSCVNREPARGGVRPRI